MCAVCISRAVGDEVLQQGTRWRCQMQSHFSEEAFKFPSVPECDAALLLQSSSGNKTAGVGGVFAVVCQCGVNCQVQSVCFEIWGHFLNININFN